MNASVRHEDLATFPARAAGIRGIPSSRSRRRRSLLGMVLFTSVAAGSAAIATAAGEPGGLAALGFGVKSSAAPAAPLPPGADEPAASDASRVIRSGSAVGSRPPVAKPAPQRLMLWNPLEAFGASAEPKRPAEAQAASREAGAKPRPAVRATASETVGRFDPEFGTAVHVVADGRPGGVVQRPQPTATASGEFHSGDEPEHSVSVSDEPVSLVGWLASQYAGYGERPAPGPCRDVCLKDSCCPTWEAQVDALFLWQGNIPSQPLYFNTATEQPVLDVNQLQNRAAIAPRYAILYHHDECRTIEANYFQVWGFNSFASVGPAFDQDGNGAYTVNILNNVAFSNVAQAQATGTAHIQSLEVNLRRGDQGMIEWITGFRWVEWGQGLFISDYVINAEDPIAKPEQINVTTLNNLYGWQWGGDMMLWNAGRWFRVNGIGKAGLYYNHQASQNTFYNPFDPATGPVSVSASKDAVAFVGEAGVNCSWSITNWLSWRAGYSFFWLSGVAVPANQLKLTDLGTGTTAVNATSSVYLHGVTTGLEARW